MEKQTKISERFLPGGVIFVNNKGICKNASEVDSLPIPIEEIKLCIKWINKFAKKTAEVNKEAFSYKLQYTIRDCFDKYVGNGAVIQAAIILGYTIEEKGVNAYFNMEFNEKEN